MSAVWKNVYQDVVDVVSSSVPDTATKRGGKAFRHIDNVLDSEDLRDMAGADRHFAVYCDGSVDGDGRVGQLTEYLGLVSTLTVVVTYTPSRKLSDIVKMIGQDRDLLKHRLEIPTLYASASKVWRRQVTSTSFDIGEGNTLLTLELECSYTPTWT